MNASRLASLRIVVTLVLVAGNAMPAWAQAPLLIDIEIGTGRTGRPEVVAFVQDPSGAPVTRRSVDFFLIPDFFPNAGKRLHGGHPVYLGTGTTDTVGRAAAMFTPPFTGTALIEAHVTTSAGATEAVGRADLDIVREVSPIPTSIVQPLDQIRQPLGFGVLGLVVIVWLFLGTLAIVTVRRIARLGRSPETQRSSRTVREGTV